MEVCGCGLVPGPTVVTVASVLGQSMGLSVQDLACLIVGHRLLVGVSELIDDAGQPVGATCTPLDPRHVQQGVEDYPLRPGSSLPQAEAAADGDLVCEVHGDAAIA